MYEYKLFPSFTIVPSRVRGWVGSRLKRIHLSLTARLHTEREKGFFTGRIEAMDIENHRYWVAFDRPGLGKHAILDTEIRVSGASYRSTLATVMVVVVLGGL